MPYLLSHLLSLGALLCAPAAAQTPSQPWQTARTEHFRIHYPTAAAPWAEDAAGRLEAWHERVTAEIGWTPPRTIDVIVVDPLSDANGAALPFLRAPRMILFATPPDAASVIGHYRSWGEILIVHEDAHLVHLLRPSRNPVARAAGSVLGLGPLARKSPRWVTEGYATVVEGRLSAFGRPNGDGRALMLRRLAATGQLPSYAELSSSSRWWGGSFAYLVGSAYLEWLEARAGEGSLRDLWARMSARRTRSFEDAFTGVFGAPPAELYGLFAADLTASAVAVEGQLPPHEEPLLRIGWNAGAPAVSPDGGTVAVPVFPQRRAPSVELWSVEPDAEAAEKLQEAEQKRLERDPEDVASVAVGPEPRKRTQRRTHALVAAREARWLPDGSGLLLSAWRRDGTGRLRPDLYRWTLDGGRTERITHRDDVRTADPAPDGTWAAAVQSDWGRTRIVRVDLATGELAPLTELGLDQVDVPRVSPDGKRLAWLLNDGAGFGVVVRDLETGDEWRTTPGETGAVALSIAWSRDGHALLGSLGEGGLVEVHEIWRDGGRGRGRLTQTAGGALLADPIDADRALALSMSYRGLDLHEVPLDGPIAPLPAQGPLALRPLPPDAPPMPDPAPFEASRYGLGPMDLSPIVAAAIGSSGQGQAELGLRLGDLVGRSEWMLLGAYGGGRGGVTGGRAMATFDVLPVQIGIDAYAGGDEAFDARRAGVGLQLARRVQGSIASATGKLAALAETPVADDPIGARQLVYASGGMGLIEPKTAAIGLGLGLRAAIGRTDGTPYQQVVASGTLRLLRRVPVWLGYETGTSSGATQLDQFSLGGQPASVSYAPANLWRVYDPIYSAGTLSGPRYDSAELSLGSPWSLFVQRRRIGFDLDDRGLSAVGLRVEAVVDRQPIGRIPSVRTQAGVACRIEWPGQGFVKNACLHPGDYTGWLGLTWDR